MRVQVKIEPRYVENLDRIMKRIHDVDRSFIASKTPWYIVKRSLDARGRKPIYVLTIETGQERPVEKIRYKSVGHGQKVHIVGAGPAGYFAALRLLEKGMRPVVIDRGKDVRARRRDLRGIQQYGIVHSDSNYCFGEGGAGTYSDGKLYTRSHKRGKIKDILQILVDHGAKSDILIDAHPHIGSNKLPGIVAAIRSTIEEHGGQVLFDSRVTDFRIHKSRLASLVINDEHEIEVGRVILATGHSARDIYAMLHEKGCTLEFKPFAMGVRIEHPQALIDEVQYGKKGHREILPAASYKLTCQVDNTGVFSFCMCPGGLVVPAATAPGELVVNGMSLSKRDSPFANSGTVMQIEAPRLQKMGYTGIFAGLDFQKKAEQDVWSYGDGTQKSPAQRLTDFTHSKVSQDLPGSSYIPGIYSAPMHDILPAFITEYLQSAIGQFDKKMKGYFTNEALVIGLESRTSSPVRIPRDRITFEHPDLSGLFPCGEGAGYAGGILSAAMDGRNVADKVVESLTVT